MATNKFPTLSPFFIGFIIMGAAICAGIAAGIANARMTVALIENREEEEAKRKEFEQKVDDYVYAIFVAEGLGLDVKRRPSENAEIGPRRRWFIDTNIVFASAMNMTNGHPDKARANRVKEILSEAEGSDREWLAWHFKILDAAIMKVEQIRADHVWQNVQPVSKSGAADEGGRNIGATDGTVAR